ncbi:riboflavin-specific deaminase C-terminal domain-containing protein [Marinobacter daqiaonensis]|uniref:Riboflavin-specific deaminase C-terminal domain-containing protein n=1 Tax=Marinobacter daqiaonensis TaxID=650891 RepID=A0A1I6H079_9GAMM|nr:RibD family protein [Marinobacter daqiaonensis]SFR47869.1 riboflavin-specific deaminase C-terminal domain-containing protein [Marinobacter daqiaonensis]
MTPEQAWQMILDQRQRPGSPAGAHWTEDEAAGEDEYARQLLRLFRPLVSPLPRGHSVIAQLGQSLDGRIATVTGKSRYINGEDGLVHLHRLRAVSDAVVVGSGTASVDNPRLTVRLAQGPNPVRVVIDRHRRVPDGHNLFTDGVAPTLRLVAGVPGRTPKLPPLPIQGVHEIACLTEDDGPIDGEEVLAVLRQLGLKRVFVEGGGQTVSTFLGAGLVDRLHVLVAPMIIGSGQPAFSLPEIDSLRDALRPDARMVNLGSDMLFDLDFRAGA